MKNRIRYTIENVKNSRYYQMPKFLFEGDFKTGLSNDSKMLYTLLKDRHELSIQNKWLNENNEVYLIYSREEMAEMLGCTQPTLRKSINQLIEAGLMDEERMGFNRPNRIYLTLVTLDNQGLKDSFTPDCKNLSVMNENNLHSGVKNSFSPDCKLFSPNDTNLNQTDFNNTNNQSIDQSSTETMDTIDKNPLVFYPLKDKVVISTSLNDQEIYRKLLIDNIEFLDLKEEYKYDSILDDLLNTMIEIVTSNKEFIRVNGEEKPLELIKQVFLKLNKDHIVYVLNCFEKTTTKANNIRAYLITSLYNSYTTINSYYHNRVRSDMYGNKESIL